MTGITSPKKWRQIHDVQGDQLSKIDEIINKFNAVIDKDTVTPPSSPTLGDRYLIKESGLGGWFGKNDNIAEWGTRNLIDQWLYALPFEGMLTFVNDENMFYHYDGSSWERIGLSIKLNDLDDPDADVNFSFGTKHFHLTFTAPTTEAGVIFEGLGNFAGKDILHLHQSIGTLTAEARLLHMEWIDSNVKPMRWSNDGGTNHLYFNMESLGGSDYTNTFPAKTGTLAMNSETLIGSANSAWRGLNYVHAGQSIGNTSDIISNVASGVNSWVYWLNKPTNRGGLTLRIKGIRYVVMVGAGGNQVNQLDLTANPFSTGAGTTVAADPTNRNVGIVTFAFTAVDVGAYMFVQVRLSTTSLSGPATLSIRGMQCDIYYG